MMTTSKSVLKKLLISIYILFSLLPVFSAENDKWVIAAEKFSYAKGYNQTSVSEGSAEMLPMSILEKLSKTMERNVLPDEKFERENYKLRTERQSLYLQLSSEYKKRDALVLNSYSEKELQKKINGENKEIEKIQKKIDDNLESVRLNQNKMEKEMELVYSGKIENPSQNKSEFDTIKRFIRNIFIKDENIINQEKIEIYKNDFSVLYSAANNPKDLGYDNAKFQQEMNSAKINLFIAGTISGYGDYLSVNVDLYLYPSAKKIGSVMEIGTLQDADLIASSITNQILPLLTNALPVLLDFKINPPEAAAKAQIFIDDILQTSETSSVMLESGVHTIQFVSDGFRTAGTSYYFTGNTEYNIEVEFQEQKDGFLQIEFPKPLTGDFLVNGQYADNINPRKTQLKINGKKILGEFISENGDTAFFFIPENLVFDSSVVKLNPKAYNREENIDKRRRWMYASYSLLIISLIPTYYSYGKLDSNAKLYTQGTIEYDEAIKYQNRARICEGITIGCGVFFIYELVRYLISANSVLPQKAKAGDLSHYEYYEAVAAEEKENPAPVASEVDNKKDNEIKAE